MCDRTEPANGQERAYKARWASMAKWHSVHAVPLQAIISSTCCLCILHLGIRNRNEMNEWAKGLIRFVFPK
eukprot:1146530-Pelagomonas_calceolata.AAC.4